MELEGCSETFLYSENRGYISNLKLRKEAASLVSISFVLQQNAARVGCAVELVIACF